MSETATLSQALCDGVDIESILPALRQRVLATTGGVPARERGEYIAKNFPEMAGDTVRMANEALLGRLVLPGGGPEPVFAGNPPQWSENPFGDNEYTFHLNRMHHWKTMCEAYAITGDLRFAKKTLDELLDWMENCPCPAINAPDGSPATACFDGLAIWRALEVGIRGYRTWPLVIELLCDSGLITEALLRKLLPCVFLHCRVLYEISPLLWPKADHNHYLMENLGLLSLACLFPELRGSEKYKSHAEHELDRCMRAQCTNGGGQIEGCPSYHNGCVFWFALRLTLADKYDLSVPEEYVRSLRKMFSHSLHATRACGGNFPWGDSHAAECETMSLAAVSCYMAFGEREYLALARAFYPLSTILGDLRDNLFRLRRLPRLAEDIAWADSHPKVPDCDTFAWQRELDQVYFRSGWGRDALSVMTACRSPVQNQHAHIDAGGFDFTAYGAVLVCDPGIFTYKDCEARHYFKGSLSHSCLTIDGRDMWEYISSWAYGPQRKGHIFFAAREEGLSYSASRHLNYSPATATRVLAMVDNSFLLVLDILENAPQHGIAQVSFHLPRERTRHTEDGCVVSVSEHGPNLLLCAGGDFESVKTEEAKYSPAGDVSLPSRIVRYQARLRGETFRQATLLAPLKVGQSPPKMEKPVITATEHRTEVAFSIDGKPYQLLFENDRLFRLS